MATPGLQSLCHNPKLPTHFHVSSFFHFVSLPLPLCPLLSAITVFVCRLLRYPPSRCFLFLLFFVLFPQSLSFSLLTRALVLLTRRGKLRRLSAFASILSFIFTNLIDHREESTDIFYYGQDETERKNFPRFEYDSSILDVFLPVQQALNTRSLIFDFSRHWLATT